MRIIGIRHRTKKTKDGDARPTLVAILDGEARIAHELNDDTAELDFVLGRFPTSWREVEPNEDLTKFPRHHVREEKSRKRDAAKDAKVIRVPANYDGLQSGDTVAMALGGSGDRLAFALSRRGDEIHASLMRTPPYVLKAKRGERPKEEDHFALAELATAEPQLFTRVGAADRTLIRVREAYRSRRFTQQDRIACEQRLRQQTIGAVFLSEEGRYPEGSIEDEYDRVKTSDPGLSFLESEEAKRERELKNEVRKLAIWPGVFAPIVGIGEVLAAGLISSVGDIRRFASASKFAKFCGVHVMADGSFPRFRRGLTGDDQSHHNPTARQTMFLIADQFNYRPESYWGQYLRSTKARMRERHPEPVAIGNTKKYTDAHIARMARWRTLTRFAESLYKEWYAAETEARREERA